MDGVHHELVDVLTGVHHRVVLGPGRRRVDVGHFSCVLDVLTVRIVGQGLKAAILATVVFILVRADSFISAHLIEVGFRYVWISIDTQEHSHVEHALNHWDLKQISHVFDQLTLNLVAALLDS